MENTKHNLEFFFNEHGFKKEVETMNEAKPLFQHLVNEFHKLNIFNLGNKNQLIALIDYGQKYIKDQLAASLEDADLMVGKFKKKREAHVADLDLPNFDPIDNLAFALQKYSYMLNLLFDFDGRTIRIKENANEMIRKKHSITAQTPAQTKVLECHRAASKALDDLSKALHDARGFGLEGHHKYNDMFLFLEENGRTSIKYYQEFYNLNFHQFVKHIERNK